MARACVRRWVAVLAVAGVALAGCASRTAERVSLETAETAPRGSVIFIHPDGGSSASWAAARALLVGPDGMLNWDRLESVAVYRGHLRDSLTASSNGGATAHAMGRKALYASYGAMEAERVGEADACSVGVQALRAGLGVGLVQTGVLTEPGTGCFLARAPSRRMHEEIAAALVESGADVLMGGGERWLLPEGVRGVHGEGSRTDGRDLIAEARAMGYTVVRTREELREMPGGTTRVLGVFAWGDTYNDRSEEALREAGLEDYDAGAPTVAEMTRAALRVLGARGGRFLLVVEEEGSDNFANHNNARGALEAMRRADEAFGVALNHLDEHPETLILTAADSDAGGMRMVGFPVDGRGVPETVPAEAGNGAPMDGRDGTGTPPFVAAPDRFGRRMPFGVAWAAYRDTSGAVLARASGLNAELVRGSMDNTEITRLIRLTLFGEPRPFGCGDDGPAFRVELDGVASTPIGAGQGAAVIGGKLYLYGDAETGIVREYDLDAARRGTLRPTGRVLRLTMGGANVASHPTGLTWHPDHGAFIGDTVRGRGTIWHFDWDKAWARGTLDDAVINVTRDDLANNGTRPEFVRVGDRWLIATADYGDSGNALRLYDPARLAEAAVTGAPGVLVAEHPAGTFVQTLHWMDDEGLLVEVRNQVAGLRYRLAMSRFGPGGVPRPAGMLEMDRPLDELEGFVGVGGGRCVTVSAWPEDNVRFGRLEWRD